MRIVRSAIGTFCVLFSTLILAQDFSNSPFSVQSLEALTPESALADAALFPKDRDGHFYFSSPFSASVEGAMPEVGSSEQLQLVLDPNSLEELFHTDREFVSLRLPAPVNDDIVLELYRVELLTPDFVVHTSGEGVMDVELPKGHYYRGVVEGDPGSMVAISVFENEIIGMVSQDGISKVLRPSEKDNLYLFSMDHDRTSTRDFSCEALDHPEMKGAPQQGQATEEAKCVKVYIECDYALYQNKGGTTGTVNWITAVFNNVATLYANENITTVISEIFVWSTPDSYSKTSAYNALIQFRNTRRTFNGDLAHLAALGGRNTGGIAWLDALCSSYGYAYSNIGSTYRTVPSYSWTVEVMTHEMGHSLGSNHTHWCGWTGGALDNCYTPEGSCPRGPAPTSGGTIMSYCHITSYGINFNNGFGTQPGDKIRAEVAAAPCLTTDCGGTGGGGGCSAPSGLTASGITQSSALLSWNSVSGATSYNLEYKVSGTSTWTQINTTSTSYLLSGLTMSTTYNARVSAICGSEKSTYSTTINFTTTGLSRYCTSKGNDSSKEWIRRCKNRHN